jgi:hypothetical protein
MSSYSRWQKERLHQLAEQGRPLTRDELAWFESAAGNETASGNFPALSSLIDGTVNEAEWSYCIDTIEDMEGIVNEFLRKMLVMGMPPRVIPAKHGTAFVCAVPVHSRHGSTNVDVGLYDEVARRNRAERLGNNFSGTRYCISWDTDECGHYDVVALVAAMFDLLCKTGKTRHCA